MCDCVCECVCVVPPKSINENQQRPPFWGGGQSVRPVREGCVWNFIDKFPLPPHLQVPSLPPTPSIFSPLASSKAGSDFLKLS